MPHRLLVLDVRFKKPNSPPSAPRDSPVASPAGTLARNSKGVKGTPCGAAILGHVILVGPEEL